MTAAVCPESKKFEQALLGQHPLPEIDPLEKHLTQCDVCARTVDDLLARDTVVAMLKGHKTATPFDDDVHALIERVRRIRPPADPVPATRPPGSGHGPVQLDRIAHYRILKELGHGGMGRVYLAEDTQLQRQVALKVMRPDLAASDEARKRFLREARAMAAIQHERIITVHQVGEENGVPFLAMQLLKGMTLAAWLQKGQKRTLGQTLYVARQVAEGLAVAHAKGLIHRDVKPANIWLEPPKGNVKLLDFGLVKAPDATDPLTQEGELMGTPAFMSPEQIEGSTALDARCDLFSLGCVLYQLCTGEVPFRGPNVGAVLNSVLNKHPRPVRELNPEVPQGMADLVVRLLAKKPENRPASAKDVVAELQRLGQVLDKAATPTPAPLQPIRTLSPVSPRANGKGARPRLMAMAAVILLAVLLAAGVVIYIQTDKGQLAIESKDPQVAVLVNKPGMVVIKDSRTGASYELRAGKADLPSGDFTIEVTDPASGLQVETKTFTIKRGDEVAVRAWIKRDTGSGGPGGGPTIAPIPEYVRFDKPFINSIGMPLMPIRGGRFFMGAREGEAGYAPDRWRHEVEITRPFLMGIHEVTVGQFAAFVQETKYVTMAEAQGNALRLIGSEFRNDPKTNWRNPGYPGQTDEFPVVCVSWHDAKLFCAWLSEKVRRVYRLPSEAEWEYACRAGSTSAYSFGELAKDLADYAWFGGNSGNRAHPVGQLKPNAWGLYDMLGNASEWCADYKDDDYYKRSPLRDPPGTDKPGSRIHRGSGWWEPPQQSASAHRSADPPSYCDSMLGFRVVCEIPAIDPASK